MNQPWINPAAAIHRWARISGSDPAIIHDDGTLTFAELSRRVRRTAAVLAAGGARRGSRVAYLGMNSPLFLETLLAAAHLGAVFVPVNFRLAPDEVAYVLGNAGCHSVVAEDGHRGLADGIADSVPVHRFYLDGEDGDGRWQPIGGGAADPADPADPVAPADPVPAGADDVALLMYTSGTTGRPKGVILTYGNLWWNQVNVQAAIDIRPRAATLAVAPLFHIGGLNAFTLGTLTRGGPVVLRRAFDPQRCLQDVARYRIASTFMVPVMFAAMLRSEDFARTDLSSLRAAVVAGAPVPPALVAEYAEHGVALQQAWGLTETAPFATYLPPHLVRTHPASAGFAMPYSEVRVLSPRTGLPVTDPGMPGELCVRGPNVMRGYWNDPEATSAAIDADGWFSTGDLGFLDEQGLCYIVDRLKDLIISGGENVSPAEIERVLAEFPGVRDVAVVGVPDPRWGQTPVAVLCHGGEPPTLDAVRAFTSERLARFKLPTGVVHLEALPRNASGKIDRAALRALVTGRSGNGTRNLMEKGRS
ncbi:acyl-CoA synthetase [Actinoallomurus soli]|uniref:acyl-CoA synthetase n=1 Tax=Actinoallomurus soli TaxID=2952535 RepID=UPI0020939E86|nr:long-chain fatty acid--CoA ligase [Actinoallomurus soli]MCO5968347.1 long-chain fatty acid--CoA ligase [Actinoallomurus soli]